LARGRRTGALSRRLGDRGTRRRRHQRFAVAAIALLVLAAVLVLAFGDEGDDFRSEATATCEAFGDRIQREFALTFPEGAPGAEAEAEYLSRAFADTMDELVATLRDLDGAESASEAIDALAARIAEVRADPASFVAAREDPFAAGVAPAFDRLDLPACGSEFFAAPS
jgi:ABC-type transporter Mla subunit MlaD